MTPNEFKEIRKSLGLSLSEMADMLGYETANGADQVRSMESGKKTIMPAQARLMAAYRDGYRPDDWAGDPDEGDLDALLSIMRRFNRAFARVCLDHPEAVHVSRNAGMSLIGALKQKFPEFREDIGKEVVAGADRFYKTIEVVGMKIRYPGKDRF